MHLVLKVMQTCHKVAATTQGCNNHAALKVATTWKFPCLVSCKYPNMEFTNTFQIVVIATYIHNCDRLHENVHRP